MAIKRIQLQDGGEELGMVKAKLVKYFPIEQKDGTTSFGVLTNPCVRLLLETVFDNGHVFVTKITLTKHGFNWHWQDQNEEIRDARTGRTLRNLDGSYQTKVVKSSTGTMPTASFIRFLIEDRKLSTDLVGEIITEMVKVAEDAKREAAKKGKKAA